MAEKMISDGVFVYDIHTMIFHGVRRLLVGRLIC